MISNAQLKRMATATLDNHWGDAVVLTLLLVLIEAALCVPAVLAGSDTAAGQTLQVIANVLILPIAWSYTVGYLALMRHGRLPGAGALLSGYGDFVRIFGTYLLKYIYVCLWTLLLIIPGIVKSLSYALTPYILADRPDLRYNGAIELSMRMMQGYKAKLFWLLLSFIGWFILCLFTFGIGFLWLAPYVEATMARFYEERRSEFEAEQQGPFDGGADYVEQDFVVADE